VAHHSQCGKAKTAAINLGVNPAYRGLRKVFTFKPTLQSCGQLTVTVPKSERMYTEAQNSAAAPAVSSGAAVRLTSGVASTPFVPSMGANVAAYAADPSAAQLDHAHE